MPFTVQQLAHLCGAKAKEAQHAIELVSAADIITATAHQVTLLSGAKYAKYLKNTKASACFVSPKMACQDAPKNLALLYCEDPEISFLHAVNALHPTPKYTPVISPKAAIADTALIGKNVTIDAFSSIAEYAKIGDNSVLAAGVHIGRNVSIGSNCTLHPNVVVYADTKIGNQVIIHAGSVIAADGFGYKYRDHEHIKVPHVGNVVIADKVEIGANTCIDRAALGSTTIGAGSKIDNLVQLGHNNKIGSQVIICGQAGVSGSCVIGDGAVLAGNTGIADHVTIGQQAVVMAKSGVSRDVAPKAHVFGSPAKERKTAWRELAALGQLPELLKKFKALEKRLNKN